METCFRSNVAGGSPTLESYMETRLNLAQEAFIYVFSFLLI